MSESDELSGDLPPPSLQLRWRSGFGAPPPRRIRLEIPGWAGDSIPRRDGAAAQPWHCQPFAEGSTHGLELLYPYPGECRVTAGENGAVFDGDFSAMTSAGIPHPFGVFAKGHYGMATSLDLLPPPGYSLRLGPHPRFFVDESGEAPLAVSGHLQRFWARQFFAVFKLPPPGSVHVFRPGEPYAQLLVVPAQQQYEVLPMSAELEKDRAEQDRRTTTLGYFLARRIWRSERGNWFDDRYKQLYRVFRRGGIAAVRDHLRSVEGRLPRRPGDGS